MADNVKTLLQIEKLQANIKAEQKKYNEAVKAGNISDEERLAKLKKINAEQAKLKTLKRQVNKEDKTNISLNKIQNDYAKFLSAEVNSLNKGKGVTVKKAAQVKNIADQVLTAAEREEEHKGTTAKVYGEIADFGKELNDLQVQNIKNEGQLGKEGFQKVNIAEKEQKLLKLKAMSQSKSLVGHGQSRNAMARMIKDMEKSLKHEKRHAKVLEKKNKLLLGAKNAIKGFVTKLIPAVTIGGLLIGVWKGLKTIVTGFSGLVDKLGTQFGVVGVQADDAVSPLQTNLLAARTEAIGFGKGMDDVIGITTGLSDEFGISIDEASKLSDEILDSSTAMGLSVDEGAKLFGTLMKIGKLTPAQAEDLAESTYNLAQANKVNPAAVMKDIAQNTEVFAKFGGKGSKNIMQAAVQAKKLGISLSDVAGIAENLLDFESSIEAELEASMMLGRRINMGEARRLAMTGDLEGMMNEVVKQAGGLSQWNELDIFQRKSLAKLAGTDLATMGKLVAEKARLASLTPEALDKELKAEKTMSTMTQLLNKFKQMGASLIVNIGGPLEVVLGKAKTWLETMSGGDTPFGKLKTIIDNIGKRIGTWITSFESFFVKTGESKTGLEEMKESAQKIVDKILFWGGVLAIAWVSMKAIKGTMTAISIIQDVMAKKQKIINALTLVWNAIQAATPIGLIVLAIATVIGMIIMMVKHWDKVKPILMSIWETIKAVGSIILGTLIKPFKDAWKTITGLFSGDIGIVDAIKGIAGAVLDLITWPFRTAMNLIGAIFGIESLGEKIIQPIKDGFGAGVDWVTEKFTTLKEWFGGFGEKIKNVFSGIKDFIGDIWDSLIAILKAPFNLITKGINVMIRGINSISIDVPDWLPFGGGTIGFSLPEVPELQTRKGEGWEITGGGLGVLHKEEAVGTFNFDPIIAEIRAQKAQLAKPPEIDFTGLVVEMKAMSAKLDAGNMIAEKQITKQEELHGFGGTATKAQGREFANQISRFGG